MTRKSQILTLLLLFACGGVQAQELFPIPPELQRDVDFWVNIFTHYTTDQGVLHDNRNLAVVYERVDLPANTDRRARQRDVAKRREKLQATLRTLANGKRDNLSAEEARVLALWPAGVSNATLKAAIGQIRYQQGLKNRFREGLQRSGRWRDHINKELTALGVPVELAALPHVESSYNPDARSHVGASGIWQFTRSTGRRFMRIDHVLDERNDPFAATRAAGQLLAYNYSITGNWPMAITAYNHGLSGARRAMRQFGDEAYADIMRKYKGRTFGFASRNFYVAFLAAKQVDQDPEKYFPGLTFDNPTNYSTAALKDYIPASELAAALGVTQKQLAAHNPSLQATIWQGSKHLPKNYSVRLPARLLDDSLTTLLAGVADDKWQGSQLPDLFHTIARGDTLSQIAEAYDTRVSTLVALNNLSSSNRIRAGQQLRLPAAGPAPAPAVAASAPAPEPEAVVVASVDVPAIEDPVIVAEQTPSALAGDLAASLMGTIQTALLSDPSDYSVATDNTIEVHPLETLGHYADWLGIRTQRLRDINGLAFRTPVEVGKRLRLDLTASDAKTFEDRRIAFHRQQQDGFFRENIIAGVTEHVISRGESIWILALREYDVPIWLFRQYNPEVELHNVQPGTAVHFPVLTGSDRT
ncbi:MAG: transglycosylase SLT domain-containing protein [Gammaproteobacteria bacterium]|nr:transglycosylase SLT domain-containing protein [Gammaproteobacteria bacterium]